MGKVVKIPRRYVKRVDNTEKCAGCQISLYEVDSYCELEIDRGDYKEIIGLCPDCHKESVKHGVQFK